MARPGKKPSPVDGIAKVTRIGSAPVGVAASSAAPADPIGRIVGAAIMMLGIAFLSILTATITSSFIEARQAARQAIDDEGERADQRRLEARLDELIERLDRLEVLADRKSVV